MEAQLKRKGNPEKIMRIIDAALAGIIDQWYQSVSEYYVTIEKKSQDPTVTGEEELKRFHDEKGHRIKFAKGELDFTYGLRLHTDAEIYRIEVSVNNKVSNFNYDKLVRKLQDYYSNSKHLKVSDGKVLKGVSYSAIFVIPSEIDKSIVVEKREGKADIVRMSFTIYEEYLKELTSDQRAIMSLIQYYCVSPLRKVYAEVYREKR
jgi:hypothetical protein